MNRYSLHRHPPELVRRDDGDYVLFTDYEQEVERRVREELSSVEHELQVLIDHMEGGAYQRIGALMRLHKHIKEVLEATHDKD